MNVNIGLCWLIFCGVVSCSGPQTAIGQGNPLAVQDVAPRMATFPETELVSGQQTLQTRRDHVGHLVITAVTWVNMETGPFFTDAIRDDTLRIATLAHCGTVESHTMSPMTYERTLTAEEEASIVRIVFNSYPDPLVIER